MGVGNAWHMQKVHSLKTYTRFSVIILNLCEHFDLIAKKSASFFYIFFYFLTRSFADCICLFLIISRGTKKVIYMYVVASVNMAGRCRGRVETSKGCPYQRRCQKKYWLVMNFLIVAVDILYLVKTFPLHRGTQGKRFSVPYTQLSEYFGIFFQCSTSHFFS